MPSSSSILESAAVLAWSCRARPLDTLLCSSAFHFHVRPNNRRINPASNMPRSSAPVGVKLKALSPRDLGRRDPKHSFAQRPLAVGTPSNSLSASAISPPTSPQSLYRNLLSITSSPPFSLRQVIDYYFDWPKTLHSTKSFNFLISLALRHASFASARRLFGTMRAESIPENLETWKLYVRWLVRAGKWDDAWKFILEISEHENVTPNLPSNPIPLPLWLELLGPQKRGALRHWVLTNHNPTMETGSRATRNMCSESDLDSHLNTNMKDAECSRPRFRKRLVPRSCQRLPAAELSRYRALIHFSPLLASDQVQILPRTIFIVTQKMHQVGQRNLALSTALSYLKSLPLHLRRCDRRRILDLVNFHVSAVARSGKPGLKLHFAQRRILWKFLQARPDLVPSSTTLSLLLGPLRGCRRSGTLALQCLRLFEKKWGSRVQSRSVRRRVAKLALKEGRLDIVETMIKLERRCRVSDGTFPRIAHTSRRMPWRTLFGRQGTENRRWRLVEDKYRLGNPRS